MSRNAVDPRVSRSLVLAGAFAGMIAGTFCAPTAPPPPSGPPASEPPTPTSASSTAALAPPPPASTASVVPSLGAGSAKPSPAASASASAPLPLPRVVFPKKPVPAAPSHGGKSWAVFLVLGDLTPERMALADAWWAVLPNISRGMGCHEGTGAPGQEEPYVAVYFKTEKDAKAFAAGATPPPVRIAHVKTFCMD